MIDTHLPLWRLGAELARLDDKTERVAIKRLMDTKRRHYRLGWNASDNGVDLDRAEESYLLRHGGVFMQDWLDGYDDRTAGRGLGHLQQCPDHASGTCDPSKEFPGMSDFI
jgi:hypothetical protein